VTAHVDGHRDPEIGKDDSMKITVQFAKNEISPKVCEQVESWDIKDNVLRIMFDGGNHMSIFNWESVLYMDIDKGKGS
jgi:hypothetical protein